MLKHKQQSYVCTVSVSVWEDSAFFPLIGFERLHKHTICVRIPIFASNPHKHSDLGLKRGKTGWKRKRMCNSVLDPDFCLKGEAVQYSFYLPFILIIAHC